MKTICYLHKQIHERLYCKSCDIEFCSSIEIHNKECNGGKTTTIFSVPIGMKIAMRFFAQNGNVPMWQKEIDVFMKPII